MGADFKLLDECIIFIFLLMLYFILFFVLFSYLFLFFLCILSVSPFIFFNRLLICLCHICDI